MDQITFSTTRTLTAQQLSSVFKRSGINRKTGDMALMQKMVESADSLVTAWDGELLVGVARSLTDFCAACYLADLAVDREYQKAGIGARLVAQLQGELAPEAILLLLAAPSAMEYYPKIGFDAVANGFIIRPPIQPEE